MYRKETRLPEVDANSIEKINIKMIQVSFCIVTSNWLFEADSTRLVLVNGGTILKVQPLRRALVAFQIFKQINLNKRE